MSNRNFFILLFLAIVVYAFNLRLDVMQVDAGQYAEMSWEMLSTKSFIHVHCLGGDYLDKPPLLFWLNSLSMFVLGVNNVSYKLPSMLFALLAVYSTYRFTKIYYEEKIARTAAIMLATSQAVFLITNDVRTDTMLMGAVIFSIWHFAEFFESSKSKNLLLGSFGLALALLAKGPIGLIATGAAIFPQLLLKRKLKQLFDWRIFTGLAVVLLMLLPMCIGLYQQFGTKGLTFYFWTQSFGRITGQSEWNNHPDTFFLVHTTIWAFAPWSLFFFAGWLRGLFVFIRSRFSLAGQTEIISLVGFTLVLIALMLSKYQLPHYIFVVYPLAAVIAAKCFFEANSWLRARQVLSVLQIIILVVLALISALLQWAFKGIEPISLTCLIVLYPMAIWLAIMLNKGVKNYSSLFYLSATIAIVFNFLLNSFYFPEILKYQVQNDFGRYVKANANNNFVCYHSFSDFSFVFYSRQKPIATLWSREDFRNILKQKNELVVYTSQHGLDELSADNIPYTIIEKREGFAVSGLTLQFLNPATREEACEKFYLLNVKRP